jgi:hypothetical protein
MTQRWPDPINAKEHEDFARLCAKNFTVIDVLFGKRPEIEYTGKRAVTPNLGLVIPGLADAGWAQDLADNFQKIDAAFKAALAIKGKEDVMVKMGKFAVLDEDDALRLLAGEHLRIPEGVEVLALRDYVPELAAAKKGAAE